MPPGAGIMRAYEGCGSRRRHEEQTVSSHQNFVLGGVVRPRHLQFAAAGRESGGPARRAKPLAGARARPSLARSGTGVTTASRARSGRLIARSEELELVVPECEKGLGKLIGSPTSTDLIEGVRVAPLQLHPDDRGYFLEVQRT